MASKSFIPEGGRGVVPAGTKYIKKQGKTHVYFNDQLQVWFFVERTVNRGVPGWSVEQYHESEFSSENCGGCGG